MARSRGGLTSKIHALVDTHGLPVRLALTAGQARRAPQQTHTSANQYASNLDRVVPS